MMNKETRLRMGREKRRVARVNEILDLLQEECGEVIVAVSKYRRFGEDNKEQLVQELGDVRLLIELLKAYEFATENELRIAERKKSKKLVQYSRVYEI